MTRLPVGIERRTETLFFWGLVLLALMMTLKYFPGLEFDDAYAGNVFQAIYPDAFPGDPYIGPKRLATDRAHQLSLSYLLVKLGGEIWLDDRFNALVYLGLVLLSIVGIDRIVQLAGISDVFFRLVVQLVLMRDHQIFNNKVFLAHQADFNHKVYAIPATIWLIYVTAARKPMWVILSLCVLGAFSSVRNAPLVIACCLIIAAVNGGKRDRQIVAGLFAAAAVVFYVTVVHVFPVPAGDKVALWEIMYLNIDPNQVNPFFVDPDIITTVFWNLEFAIICLAAIFVPLPSTIIIRSLRLFVVLGIAIWLLAGLYFSFAPDLLKIPHLLPFTPTRILRWPQTVAYLLILIGVFHSLKGNERVKPVVTAALVIGALLIVGPANQHLWAALFLISAATVIGWHYIRRIRNSRSQQGGKLEIESFGTQITRRAPLVFIQVLVLTIGVAYASTIWSRLPDWKTLTETGVMGGTGSAGWIGISEYIRKNTPPDASFLPLQYGYGTLDRNKLFIKRYFATRSGRPTSVISHLYSMYSLDGWKTELAQNKLRRTLAKAFEERRWAEAAEQMRHLVILPKYVILPGDLVDSSSGAISPFVEEMRVKNYVVLRYAG